LQWVTDKYKSNKEKSNYGKTLIEAENRLSTYVSGYNNFFRNKTKSNFDKVHLYIEGKVTSELNNIERISETLDTEYHAMHHFISDSNWNARAVMDQVAQDVSQSLPRQTLTGLLIDESGWVKKGDKSVGVGHQYCGNVGKTANSQVAVYSCLCNGKHASLVDCRLYLPASWTNDSQRCKKADIPVEERVFKTKEKLVADIIKHQLAMGITFDYVGADGLYGNDAAFAREINNMGLVYMFDIHSDQQIFLEKPELYLPERKTARGPSPKKLKASTDSTSVCKYIGSLEPSDWKAIVIRDSAKGILKGLFHFATVYIWDKNTNTVENRMLVVSNRKTKNGEEIKYSFTNATRGQYTEEAIAYMQAQRFFVEHSFKKHKQNLGMNQFQTRKWLPWHHQIVLNMMVGCFMLKEKRLNQDEIPILLARNIMDFLFFKFYKELTEDRLLRQLKEHHIKRQYDIDLCYSK
jgi:SRSO17 transposase